MNLKSKTVVVTGGSRGIGLSIAERCAIEGANLVLASRNSRELDEAAIKIQRVSKALVKTQVCDVCKDPELKQLMQVAAEITGSIHGLICAAGVYGAIGPFAETSIDDWVEGLEINLIGTARTIHTALKYMKEDARVVLFSGGGQAAMPNFSSYVTSKGGIWRLTETLGAELAEKKIYLNALAPGAVNTKFLDELIAAGPQKVGKDFYEKSLKQKESGGESPQKAAELVLYLLGPESKGLFGKTISALWDDYKNFSDLPKLSKSDLYCMRRVIDEQGNTRVKGSK